MHRKKTKNYVMKSLVKGPLNKVYGFPCDTLSVRTTSCLNSCSFTSWREANKERLELKGRDWPCTSCGRAQWNGCNTAELWGWCSRWCPADWAATLRASGNIYKKEREDRKTERSTNKLACCYHYIITVFAGKLTNLEYHESSTSVYNTSNR